MRLAADALADAGWEIEHVELPEFQHVFEVWNRIMCDDIPALLDAVAPVIDPRLVAALEGHIAYPYVTDLSRMAVYPERRRLMRVWRSMFATTSIVVTPVWPEPQFPGDDDLERGIDFIAHMLQFATPAPLLGLPSLALPSWARRRSAGRRSDPRRPVERRPLPRRRNRHRVDRGHLDAARSHPSDRRRLSRPLPSDRPLSRCR